MKKIIVLLLCFTLLTSLFSPVFANIQLPVDSFDVDNVFYVLGENVITGEPIINPTMTVSWEDPDAWANDIEIHEPDYYEIIVKNETFNTSETITINDGTSEFTSKTLDLHNELNLQTGSFYDISIQPYHYHVVDNGGELSYQIAPAAQEPERAYAVTDLEVEFISDEDSIQVIWDDLGVPDFEYRIVYAIGDYSSLPKQDLINNKEGEIQGLSIDSDDVERFFDPIAKRDKLTYTIDESIFPGQVYSIMVEPIAEYYNGEVVVRNRNYPYIKSVSTNVQLSLVEEGDYIRLQWEIPASFRVGQSQDEYALVEATLMEYQDGKGRNLVIFNGDAASIGYYRVTKPIWETEYELTLTYKAVDDASKPPITPVSNRLTFVPSEYLIQPTKPYVPSVISNKIIEDLKSVYTLDEIYDILQDEYLVKGYNYGAGIDDLIDEDVTFHIDEYNSSINYVWGSFQRIDVDVTSSTYGEYIYDTNVYYDVWITDELSTLAYAIPVLEDVRYNSTTDSHVITNAENDIVGYRQQFNFYYDTATKDIKEIAPNDIYYIKVQAKKLTSQGTLVSEPTISTIYYTYDGDAYEPPTIAKPPLKVKDSETSQTGVTINWKEAWYEAISPDVVNPHVLANWQHQVWADGAGTLYKEPVDNAEYFALYEGEVEIQRLRDYLTGLGINTTIISRQVDLGTDAFGISDVKYRFLNVLYQSVLNEIAEQQLVDPTYSFADYYNDLVENDRNGTATLPWQEVEPYTDTTDSSYFAFRNEGLVENTSYLFILYPYRALQNGDTLYAHYPTPIIVSTLPDIVDVTPDPTVPTLYATEFKDTSITATWKYNTDFEYDLLYSLVEDVETAEAVDIVLPTNILDPKYPRDGEYFDVVVDDLFPLTTYYFWVRARQPSNGTNSLWSNPAIGTTTDVDAPIPPRGVGLAPLSVIEDYGYDLNVTEDYIIVEWIKDLNDIDVEGDFKVDKSFTYIVEVADNPKFIDPIYIESSGGNGDIVPADVEVLEKNLIKVDGLVGNRLYYVRVKTVLVVKGSEAGQLIKKESVTYSLPIRIITLSTGDEYDGEIDPALTILPKDDFELSYNEVSKLLEFRFKKDGKDATGSRDNQVDQRLISSLIDDNMHEYVIDLNSFNNQDIERRKISIPYSIMEAFDSYNIDLRILADNMNFEVPAEGLMKKVNEQVKAYGVAPMLVIDFEDLNEDLVRDQIPDQQLEDVAVPQKLQMTVISSRKTDSIHYTDRNLSIELKTKSRYSVYEKDLALYVKDDKANWNKLSGKYDRYAGTMNFETANVGTYGLYTYDRSTTVTGTNLAPSHWSEPYRKDVYGQFTISGTIGYDPAAKVAEKAVIQATYGTVLDADQIALDKRLDQIDLLTLQRSGIKANTSQDKATITRQEAISMFVRTYEITHGTSVPVNATDLAAVKAQSGVSSTYAVNLAKAKVIGLVSDITSLRPNDSLNYGEFYTLWSRVLD